MEHSSKSCYSFTVRTHSPCRFEIRIFRFGFKSCWHFTAKIIRFFVRWHFSWFSNLISTNRFTLLFSAKIIEEKKKIHKNIWMNEWMCHTHTQSMIVGVRRCACECKLQFMQFIKCERCGIDELCVTKIDVHVHIKMHKKRRKRVTINANALIKCEYTALHCCLRNEQNN